MKGHNGLDAWQPSGTPIYASLEGVVDEVCTEEARGLGVSLTSENKYDTTEGEYQIKHRYWHLKGINVVMGQKIKVGDLIGWLDNTGYSSGDHLHFEAKQVANGINVFQQNGFYGAFNPEPYFSGKFAQAKETFTKDLKLGMSNLDVWKLQRFLVKGGYGTFTPTGFFGFKTLSAVMAYQRAKGIKPVSGYFGPITRGRMNLEY
jgi:hypothetical protein